MHNDRRSSADFARSHASGEDGSTVATHNVGGPSEALSNHVSEDGRAHRLSGANNDVSRWTTSVPVITDSPFSSLTLESRDEQRMSTNPAVEIADSLRFSDLTSPARDYFGPPTPPDSGSSQGQEMAARQGSEGRAKMDSTLPENDGMNDLRRKMHEIRMLAISTEEKALKMHNLMMQDYIAHKAVTTSPMSLDTGNSKLLDEEPAALDVGLAAMPIDPKNPYNLRPGDTEPSWSPLPPNAQDEEMEGSGDVGMLDMGCRHYKRNVKVQCFDCQRWFPCRHCHDSAHDLPFEHNLRRKMTKNMLCMLCQTPQPAAEMCAKCGEYAAYYFCPKCKLWDNDSNKRIYHCDDCGICRVGEGLGKDFVHCKRCNVCISISTSAAHPCVEGATERDCPLCLDDLFESRKKAVSMPCGHYMHGECYQDLMRITYKCPVCSKSAVNMELQWRKLDDEIRAQPMPEDEDELRNILPHVAIETNNSEPQQEDPNRSPSLQPQRPRTVYVGCNDCSRRSWTPFHWLGVKCQHCDSYNTNQMAPPAGHETETERLIRQQQIHRHHDFTGEGVLREIGIQPAGEQRADSALEIPGSPSQLAVPLSPGSPISSASGLPSPRRYFVQDEGDVRRYSFSAGRFSTPSLANLPEMPRLPRMPNLPNLRNMPNMPNLPNIPDWPNLPSMPHLDIPRFSPYNMMDSLSRSLSPMRYYLQGLDVTEDGVLGRDVRVRNRSMTSIRSDPTADATVEKRGILLDEDDEDDDELFDRVTSWGARARHFLGVDVNSDDEDLVRRAVGNEQAVDDESEDGEKEEESSESDDAEMRDDDDEEEEEDDELALLGHR